MILQVFSIEDTKANLFNTPFFMRSVGEALRAFTDLANDKNTKVAQHPTDYRLVRLGTFDDELGDFKCHQAEPLGRADEFVDVRGTVVGASVAPLKAVDNG